MAMTIGGKTPQSITIGGKGVFSLAINGEVVWSASTPSQIDYFWVKSTYPRTNYVYIDKVGSPQTGTDLEYSTDGTNWSTVTYTNGEFEIALSRNQKVYLRSTTGFSQNASNYYTIASAENIEAGGDLMSIIDYSDSTGHSIPNYAFAYMFKDATTLTDSSEIDFSNVTESVGDSACSYMFNGCLYMENAPALPTMSVANGAYKSMFYGCTALQTAPALPATSVSDSSYYQMFYGCTALTTPPPVLPATSVAGYTYASMFQGCTSLPYSPEIYASPTSYYSFGNMFNGCTSLSEITVRSASWGTGISQVPATTGFSSNVASTGTFYNLGGATIPTGTDGIPSGWTEHTSL